MTTLVEVTADIRDIIDTDAIVTGTVQFIAPTPLSLSGGEVLGNALARGREIAAGEFVLPVHLPANDSGDEAPQGWSWTIRVQTNVWSGEFRALVTMSMAPTISLGQLYRNSPDAGTVTPGVSYVSVADVGTTVAPLVAGKIPDSFLPTVSGEDGVARAAVAAEVTRAEAAEGTLATNLASETTRAEAAESTLSGAVGAKYAKPGGGIPESDLSSAVQAKLDAGGGGGSPTMRTASSGLVTGTYGPGGATGKPTTLAPSSTFAPVVAAAGDIIVWYPGMISTGADAQGDLCSVVSGAPVNYLSGGYGPVQADNGHAAFYVSGDYGLSELPVVRWVVQANDVAIDGTVTLVHLYQGGVGNHVWGHNSIPGQNDVINHGQPAA